MSKEVPFGRAIICDRWIHGEPSSRHIIKAFNSRLILLSRELLSFPTFVHIEAALWNSVVCLEQLIDSGGFLQLNLQCDTGDGRGVEQRSKQKRL
ncbi:hypothetical protein MUK42_33158 [Musa troglodytarum]|uniref:Uncharacterized protein n=1 Tax=Musa troglodytarum TaxID=320322 RepID=A0A9E7JVU6_9LILI|nr:hypothetical protein MUK42_33158 [Musa troglodytarum]